MGIIIIVISGSRRRDRGFINEFHTRSRGICGRSWVRLFGRVNRRIRGGSEGTNRLRRGIWEYSRN